MLRITLFGDVNDYVLLTLNALPVAFPATFTVFPIKFEEFDSKLSTDKISDFSAL